MDSPVEEKLLSMQERQKLWWQGVVTGLNTMSWNIFMVKNKLKEEKSKEPDR